MGHRKKATKRGALTSWRPQRRDKSGHRKKATEQGALTNWRQQGGRQVRIQKESDQTRGTYQLEMAEGGTSQDMENF